jgi:hypothetical protein
MEPPLGVWRNRSVRPRTAFRESSGLVVVPLDLHGENGAKG